MISPALKDFVLPFWKSTRTNSLKDEMTVFWPGYLELMSISNEPALGLVHVLEVILDWKATKNRELSSVLKVDPVMGVCFRQDWIPGPFDLEDFITDTDGSALDVTPGCNSRNELGWYVFTTPNQGHLQRYRPWLLPY
jgi:hypothetical protein